MMLLEFQEYHCAICKCIIDTSAHVDHDHETKEIRGLICFSCNTALGNFKDSIAILKEAIAYLESYREE